MRKRILEFLIVAGATLGCALPVLGQTVMPHVGTVEQELRALEEQRREAIKSKDFALLERIYAPEFVAVAGNGQVVNRAELFRVFAQSDPTLNFTTDEVQVLSHGQAAVFLGRLVARSASGTVAFASRFSHVFVQRDGRWVCVSGQSTPVQVK